MHEQRRPSVTRDHDGAEATQGMFPIGVRQVRESLNGTPVVNNTPAGGTTIARETEGMKGLRREVPREGSINRLILRRSLASKS